MCSPCLVGGGQTHRCGYCGVEEAEVGAELTVDHFQPRAQNGTDNAANLVYCCNACNQFKGDYWQLDRKFWGN